MNHVNDPYNKDEVIDACAKHAWETRSKEFENRGIRNESELRKEIERTVEDPSTRAFRGQPQPDPDGKIPTHALGREIYEKRPINQENKDYGISVVLNPNRDEQGQVYGGTCFIRRSDEFARLERREFDDTGVQPQSVIGGRPALREQESHRQLINVEPDQAESLHPDGLKQTTNTATTTNQKTEGTKEATMPETSIFEDFFTVASETLGEIAQGVKTEVNNLANSYSSAHPDSGATPAQAQEAAYFSKAVDDPAKFPPVNDDMKSKVSDRQISEDISNNLRERNGNADSISKEDQQPGITEDRMQSYLSMQQQKTMG
jgi:hypothetical protein